MKILNKVNQYNCILQFYKKLIFDCTRRSELGYNNYGLLLQKVKSNQNEMLHNELIRFHNACCRLLRQYWE